MAKSASKLRSRQPDGDFRRMVFTLSSRTARSLWSCHLGLSYNAGNNTNALQLQLCGCLDAEKLVNGSVSTFHGNGRGRVTVCLLFIYPKSTRLRAWETRKPHLKRFDFEST